MTRNALGKVVHRTWASGSCELLRHASDHMAFSSAFDRRVAYISVDNAVELTLRTFVALPPRFFEGQGPRREEVDESTGSFTKLIELAAKHAKRRLDGVDLNDLDFYHSLRNTLYHHGTGISVDEKHLARYYQLAAELLQRLLDVKLEDAGATSLLSRVKPEIRTEYMAQAREMRRQDKARKLKVINDQKKAQGIRIGRVRKDLSADHEGLLKQWYLEGMPLERMAHELSRQRGAFDAISVSTKRKRMISVALIKRRLAEWTKHGQIPKRPLRPREGGGA